MWNEGRISWMLRKGHNVCIGDYVNIGFEFYIYILFFLIRFIDEGIGLVYNVGEREIVVENYRK